MKPSLKKQAALLTFANFFTRGLGFCLRLFFARLMGAEALGVMEMAGSVSTLALTPVAAGVPTAMSRMTAQRTEDEREEVLRAGISYVRRMALVIMPLLLVFSPVLAYLLGDMRTLPAIAAGAPVILLFGLCGVYGGYCIGMQKTQMMAAAECTEQSVRFAASVALLMCFAGYGVAASAALPYVAEAIGGAIVVLIYHRAMSGKHKKAIPNASLRRELFGLALPIMLAQLCGSGLHAVNAVLVPVCLQRSGLSQSAATAQYGLMYGMAMPLMMLPGVITGALCSVSSPAVARLEQNGCGLKRMMRKLYLAAAGIGLASCCALFVGAGAIAVYLYNQVALAPLLRVLCPVTLILSVKQVQFGMISGLGQQARSLPGTLFSALITLLCTAWLTPCPQLRLYGTAIASILGQFSSLLWNTAVLHRSIKMICKTSTTLSASAKCKASAARPNI